MRTLIVMLLVATCANPCASKTFYGGLRFGSLSKSDEAPWYLDEPPKCVGAMVGYSYWQTGNGKVEASLEIEGNFSIDSGRVDGQWGGRYYSTDYVSGFEDEWSWDIASGALYQAFRAGSGVYILGKVGALYERVAVESNVSDTSEGWGWSIGGGIGARLTEVVFVEVEMVTIDKTLGWFGVSGGFEF